MDVQLARMTTLGLAGLCGLLVLAALVQLAGYGRGYGWLPPDESVPEELAGAIDRQPFSLPAATRFSEVSERPLFNDDRKPTPVAEADVVAEGPPPVPLNVTLTGVIVVRKTESQPELRVAMVRDNARNETMSLKVGMPLGGDQSGWTLTRLEPRVAVFTNAADETAEVELQTAATPPGKPMTPPRAPPAVPGTPPTPPGAVAPEAKPGGADTDLAKRIEERRRQMREEAERMRAERRGNSPSDQKQ